MTSKKHTPYPQGPFATGCVDIVSEYGRKGLLMRLFYPAQISGKLQNHMKNWTRWFLDEEYNKGLSSFYMPMFPNLYTYLANWITHDILIPCIWEAKMSTKETFPVIVLSHGLTANRAVQSTICTDLASHGFLVAAVEHKDASACATFFLDKNGKKQWIPLQLVGDSDNYFVRKSQIQTRVREVSKTLSFLEKLNKGEATNKLESSLDLAMFKNRLDLSKPVLVGHSFGGATVILTLRKDARFVCGLPLDPWLFPIKDDVKQLAKSISRPLLFILMEGFQDSKNLAAIKHFQNDRNTILTLRGSVHQNQVDSPLLLNYLCRLLMDCNSKLDPYLAMNLNNKLMINFIWDTLGNNKSYRKEYQNFVDKHEKDIFYGAKGTAKWMLGWNTV